MKILSTTEYTGFHLTMIGINLLAGIFMFVMALTALYLFLTGDYYISLIAGFLFTAAIGVFLAYGSYQMYKDGAEVTYKATITDFNEVYDKGYEIVDREGEIYTLVKTKK